jgi:hypothetical protein
MKEIIIAFLLLSIPIAAFADDSIWGVWRGTIGKSRIVVCFHQTNYGYSFGSYYYVRYLTPIHLSSNAGWKKWGERVWISSDTVPVPRATDSLIIWTFDSLFNDTATGCWSKIGRISQPIRLTRINPQSSDSYSAKNYEYLNSPCGCDEYNTALEVRPPVVSIDTQGIEGRHYKKLSVTSGTLSSQTIEISGNGPTIDSVNRQLRSILPHSKTEWTDFFECRRDALNSSGYDGGLEKWVKPVFWTDRWLSVVTGINSDCGGAHPGFGLTYRTWDLATGKEVTLWDWIKGCGNKSENDIGWVGPPEKLNKIIHEYANRTDNSGPDREGCREQVNNIDHYYLHIGKKGLFFSSEYNFNPCCIDVEFPYKKLLPFLTKKGRDEVELLMTESQKQ